MLFGNMVLYWPTPHDVARGMSCEHKIDGAARSVLALIVKIHSADCVNLSVFDEWGNVHPRQNVLKTQTHLAGGWSPLPRE